MALRHMESSTDYMSLLRDSPDGAEKLCADLLICVISFFRDAEALTYLADHVIRDLVLIVHQVSRSASGYLPVPPERKLIHWQCC